MPDREDQKRHRPDRNSKKDDVTDERKSIFDDILDDADRTIEETERHMKRGRRGGE